MGPLKLNDEIWYVEKSRNETVIEKYIDRDLTPEEELGEVSNTLHITYIDNPVELDHLAKATLCLIEENEFAHILDKRDSKTYPVTKIGDQCWLAGKLAYIGNDCFNNLEMRLQSCLY